MQQNFLENFLDQKTSCASRWVVPTSVASRTASSLYKCPNIPKTLGESMKFCSSHREIQSRALLQHSAGGGIITGGDLHHPGGHHDEEGVVLPRGRGFVLVAMCLISLSCS